MTFEERIVSLRRRLDMLSMPAPPSTCILWLGATVRGYGQIHFNHRTILATRAAYFLRHGVWPKVARHTCDTPSCVNVDHLLDGTQKDNAIDMINRGRARIGSTNGVARLTDDAVRIIRASTKTQRELAVEFGVDQSTICHARRGSTWKHIHNTEVKP